MAMLSVAPRRKLAIGVALATLVTTTTVVRVLQQPAHATSGGDPYTVPLAVDTNPSPTVFETNFTAMEAQVDIGNGVIANAKTFNGSIPGPEIRVKVGDTVIVHFHNGLATQKTGIHWHGIELNNRSDGTAVTQNAVPPGGDYLYRFIVPRPGVFWYHPHFHDSTNQAFRGMYGSVIVTDPNEATLQGNGTLPPQSATRTMVLSDTTVCKGSNNDTSTYNPGEPAFPSQPPPWAGPGAFPGQSGPTPKTLCETNVLKDDGNPGGAPLGNGDIPNIQVASATGQIPVVEGQTILTNGKNVGTRAGSPSAPGALGPNALTLPVTAGQGVRFQFVNAATTRYFRLRLTTSTGVQIPLVRVGGEGGLLDSAVIDGGTTPDPTHGNALYDSLYGAGEVVLPPGDRADIVAAIPANATGTATMWTLDFQRTGGGFSNLPTTPVAHLAVTGAQAQYAITNGTPLRSSIAGQSVPVLPGPTTTLLNPATFVPQKVQPGLASQDIKITTMAGGPPTIDNIVGQHDESIDYTQVQRMGNARYARLGDILELSVDNTTGAHHPFHLHGFSIQPLRLVKNGGAGPDFAFPRTEFRDEVDVPGQYTLVFRVKLDDRPQPDGTTPGGGLGRWLMHCHIFFHHSLGMLSELIVLPAGQPPANGNERPYVDADAVSVTAAVGTPSTMTGTVSDPDGDAVTLTASVGNVVNNNNGTWTWSNPNTTLPGFVFITATDPLGNKSQALFELKVTCGSTISGVQPSNATLSGSSVCVNNATFPGSVTVSPGTTVVLNGANIAGNLVANGSGAIAVCNSTVNGQASINNATGFVLIGDPGDDGCAGNSLRTVSLSGNTAGIEVNNNVLNAGTLTVNNTSGSGPFPNDVAPNIESNNIGGSLSCSGNTLTPTNNGHGNNVAGRRAGQCVAV